MAGIIGRTVVLLAELGWTIVVEPATPATKVVAPKVCTFIEVITSVEITTSAVISTSTKASTPTAWDVGWYTTTNCCTELAM